MAYLRQDRIAHLSRLVQERTFPDTARFVTRGTPVTDAWGVRQRTGLVLREYDGITDIPCHFYQSRAFENERLPAQEVVANRYYIEVPIDFTFDHSDYIHAPDGRVFEIRKVSGESRLAMTTELQLGEVMNDIDRKDIVEAVVNA